MAGFIDAIAGGGGLIQLPGLLLLFPGLPAATLLGTNKVASVFGTSAALWSYARRGVSPPWGAVVPAALSAFVGSFAGARLAMHLPTAWMRPLVILLLAGVFVFLQTRKDFGTASHAPRPRARALAILLGGGVGLYDGFFGPGTGTFLLLGLVGILGLDFLGASVASKVVNVSTNLAAIAAFAWGGHVHWKVALPMAAFNILGARFGSRLALAKGARFVRKMFLVIVAALLVKLSWDFLRPLL